MSEQTTKVKEKVQSTRVTEVTIIPIKPKNGLVAIASCVIDDKFYIGSIGLFTKVKEGGGGYKLTYPNKKVGENTLNIFHPINKECGDAVEKAVIEKYQELMSKDM